MENSKPPLRMSYQNTNFRLLYLYNFPGEHKTGKTRIDIFQGKISRREILQPRDFSEMKSRKI